jgi:hypothetical protein
VVKDGKIIHAKGWSRSILLKKSMQATLFGCFNGKRLAALAVLVDEGKN